MKKVKPITLRAFVIENKSLTQSSSDLFLLLSDKLNNTVVDDRRMIINPDDPRQEQDLISDFIERGSASLFSTMLRIEPNSDVLNIPASMLQQEKINISDLKTVQEGLPNLYKDHYYFLLNENYLITTLKRPTTIMRLQVYINWLLDAEREDNLYEFTPKIVTQDIALNQLQSIKVQDYKTIPINTSDEKNVKSANKKISPELLDKVLELINIKDIKGVDKYMLERVISAELFIKFKKVKEFTNEEYQKKLGALMKPISDTDNITYHLKGGGTIKGSDIEKTKKVEIETTDSNFISENQLIQAMEKFAKELKDENKSK